MLDDFEDDLDVDNEDELMDDQNKAMMAGELNMIKSASSEMLAEGERKMKYAHQGAEVDKYMNLD